MELRGPTLTLRLPAPSDAEALLALGSDPEVTRWFSWGPYRSVAEPRAYLDRLPGQRERGQQLDLLIVHREHGAAGITGLSELSRRDRRAMVGTWLGRRFWGTGANEESKGLVLHLAFEVLELERVGAYANVDHARSQRALEKLGFRREGTLRRWHRHGDESLDVAIFGLLRDEWRPPPFAVEVEGEPPAAFSPGGTPS